MQHLGYNSWCPECCLWFEGFPRHSISLSLKSMKWDPYLSLFQGNMAACMAKGAGCRERWVPLVLDAHGYLILCIDAFLVTTILPEFLMYCCGNWPLGWPGVCTVFTLARLRQLLQGCVRLTWNVMACAEAEALLWVVIHLPASVLLLETCFFSNNDHPHFQRYWGQRCVSEMLWIPLSLYIYIYLKGSTEMS